MTVTEAAVPLRVIVAEMDRAKKLAEQAQRTHDAFAQEVGFDRVYARDVAVGEFVVFADGDYEVAAIEPYAYENDEYRRVSLFRDGTFETVRWDDYDLVSRRRPPLRAGAVLDGRSQVARLH